MKQGWGFTTFFKDAKVIVLQIENSISSTQRLII